MTRLGYDPQAAASMFQILERQRAASGSSIPEWQSSHPDPGNRVAAAQQRAQADGSPGGTVRAAEYLRHIDGLVYGPDPRQGFFQGDRFIHPELRFQVDFPGDWQRQNTPSAVAAGSPDNDALIELTLAPGKTPSQAAAEFFQIEGLQRTGSANRNVNGLPAILGSFRIQTQQGVLEGLVMFIEHRGNTYRMLGYTPQARFGRYSPTFERTLASFAPATGSLNVEPKRIDIVRVPESMTVETFNQRFPSTIDVEDLLLLNGWTAGQRLDAGSSAKRVTGSGGPR
jgi:predicted Zn-dependent protease